MADEMKMTELNAESLEQVTGGVIRYINTGGSSKSQVRSSPTQGEDNRQDSLANGTQVDTIDDSLWWDDVSGRHYVQISYTNKKGQHRVGWVASSHVGLPR